MKALMFKASPEDKFEIDSEGNLLFYGKSSGEPTKYSFRSNQYCLDNVINYCSKDPFETQACDSVILLRVGRVYF